MKNTATLVSYYGRKPMEMTVRCPELPRKSAFVKIIELVGFRPRLYAGHVVPGEYQFWSAHEGEFEAAENIVKLAGASRSSNACARSSRWRRRHAATR